MLDRLEQASKHSQLNIFGNPLSHLFDPAVFLVKVYLGCVSQGWLVYYDWDTGEEVSREQISQDTYRPGTSIYYVGVHQRGAEETEAPLFGQ